MKTEGEESGVTESAGGLAVRDCLPRQERKDTKAGRVSVQCLRGLLSKFVTMKIRRVTPTPQCQLQLHQDDSPQGA